MGYVADIKSTIEKTLKVINISYKGKSVFLTQDEALVVLDLIKVVYFDRDDAFEDGDDDKFITYTSGKVSVRIDPAWVGICLDGERVVYEHIYDFFNELTFATQLGD